MVDILDTILVFRNESSTEPVKPREDVVKLPAKAPTELIALQEGS
tara:strand:+ start:209 stop:343 length:135 start_codon:yes stop_codon:yes gene_type:complete